MPSLKPKTKTPCLGVVMDPLEKINLKKDSTIAMLVAAQNRDLPIYVMEQRHLSIRNGQPFSTRQALTLTLEQDDWYQLAEPETKPLTELDVILMRKDPPFDMNYIHSTYVLELAEKAGSLVINKPQSLRDANEKVFINHFPECIAPTIYSMNMVELKAFIHEQKHVVLKPLDSMGGTMIFMVKDNETNLNVILETLTNNGTVMITAQKFIPEITAGDKRILLVDGEAIPYGLARLPSKHDPRGNLAAGGTGKLFELSKRDHWLCQQIAPTLREKGLVFVGIDVIGDFITEINVTSPTCIKEIEQGSGIAIADRLIDQVLHLLSKG